MKAYNFHISKLKGSVLQSLLVISLALVGVLGTTSQTKQNVETDAAIAVNDAAAEKVELEKASDIQIADNYKTEFSRANVELAKKRTSDIGVGLANYIQIGGKTLAITDVSAISVDVGNGVYRYTGGQGQSYIYGHNSSAIFGHLEGLPVGSIFTVSKNGVAKQYRIEKKVTLEEYNTHMASREAGPFYYHGIFQGARYDILIQTCAGTSLGGGNSTHRLFILANPA